MANFDAERRIEGEQIRNRLREVWDTILDARQPIEAIEASVTGPGKGPERAPQSGWAPFAVHERWGGFDQTTWFRMRMTVSEAMKGQRVVALIRPGGESLAYVNGKPFQGLDRNRDELLLTPKAKVGQVFEIVLESVPSVRFDEYHYFEYADLAVKRMLPWEFYWDCKTAFEVLKELDPNFAPARQLLDLLKSALWAVDFQHKDEAAYFDSMVQAQRLLRKGLKAFEASYGMGSLSVMGQSHIDTAWLWPLRETRRKCGRTFSTVLELLDQYPEFIFLCSQPVQFEWMKEHYPEQFRRIKRYVKEGRWEPFGAMWVESDCNIPSGESLVRQLLYGNRFFRREFGMQSRCAWLPDAFGYSWTMPQILKKAQVDSFITTKITWSRFTDFPYSMFQWEGLDGTRVLGLMPPLNYNGNTHPHDCIDQWNRFKQKDKIGELPFCFGHGDGGGGPTMEMIEYAKRLGNVVGVPKVKFGRMQDCIDRMRRDVDFDGLPVFNGELYLEYHRGCQTSQARTKKNNRQCELLLRNAEWLGSLALLDGGAYDQRSLYEAWKIVLTNQFHDILPGSSIRGVYEDTERDYAQARERTAAVLDGALSHLAGHINTAGDGTPVIVFNPLSWPRTDVVSVDVKLPRGAFRVVGPDGAPVLHQVGGSGELLFEAQAVPPLGYAVYHIVKGAADVADAARLKVSERGLENECLRVRFDRSGCLSSVFDKVENREVLATGQRGNDIQLFDDRPHGNEAWDIDHNFEDAMWRPGPATFEVVEEGPLRIAVRVTRRTEKSVIAQDVRLTAHGTRLDFATRVDWHETRVLMKAAFPVDVRASNATYETPFGAIERATHHNTAWDRARYEVPAHRWADLSEGDYGVSLLNDCKYGYDTKGHVLRLSLLRSPIDPDPKADQGAHAFTYSLYPHGASWRNGTLQQAHELNNALIAAPVECHAGALPSVDAFASVDMENVIIDTVKRHEDSDAIIVRLYEAFGQRGDVALTFGRMPVSVTECDLMEENDVPVKRKGSTVSFYMTPFEIRTFKVEF
ncbi:MAG TPA: alpha-mannosidase [Candidatus Hydrogenedentes bacterium]|nr:alpha-mannosidase [Candidatus Hydrogenedentota bacterium]HPG66354.1 alpha-mannosidase [Candidatus Hydrogenedentota bacterium]